MQTREVSMMNEPAPQSDLFKKCTMCSHAWTSRLGFLEDPSVTVVGYQSFLPHPEQGLFLFNHLSCMTTLALEAQVFVDLYQGPMYSERMTGTDACPGYCLSSGELSLCPNECECAYVREVLKIVRQWPKLQGD